MPHRPQSPQHLNVLVACPSDAAAERDLIVDELRLWNEQQGRHRGVYLDPLQWPRNAIATSLPGGSAQAAYDHNVANATHITFAVFKHRLGSPTPEGDPSGTYHEIDDSLNSGKPTHVFRCGQPEQYDVSSREARRKVNEEADRLQDALDLIIPRATVLPFLNEDELRILVRDAIEPDVQNLVPDTATSAQSDTQIGNRHRRVRVNTGRAVSTGFQARQLVRDMIADAWQRNATAVVLSGGGGYGKTQLAIQLMLEATNDDLHTAADVVVWADAATLGGVHRAYAKAATQLGLESSEDTDPVVLSERFLEYLSDTPELTFLVILDNADEDFAELVQSGLIPVGDGDRKRVLLTTRFHNPIVYGQGRQVVPVDVFTPAEAVAFVHDRLETHGQLALDNGNVPQLCEALGWLPLGLSISTAIMMGRHLTSSAFATQLGTNRRQRSRLLGAPDPEGYPRALAEVWATALEHLDRMSPSGAVRRAALAAALLDPAGHHARIWATPSLQEFVTDTTPMQISEDEPLDELLMLEEFGILSTSGSAWPDRTVRMHPLTSLAILGSQDDSNHTSITHAAAVAVAQAYQEMWANAARYTDQNDESLSLRNLMHLLTQQSAGDLLHSGVLRTCLQAILRLADRGAPTTALQSVESILADTTNTLGSQSRDVLFAKYMQAYCVGKTGSHAEALKQLDNVLVAQHVTFSNANDPDTLMTRLALVDEKKATSGAEPAIEDLEQLIPLCFREFGSMDVRTFRARKQMASAKGDFGLKRERIQSLEEILSDEQRLYGTENHPEILDTKYRLSVALGESGRVREAAEMGREVATSATKVLGARDLQAFRYSAQSARWQANAGDITGALNRYPEIIDEMSEVFGPDHPDLLVARHNYAACLRQTGRFNEAIQVGRQVLADRERVLGEMSLGARATRLVVTNAVADSGRLDDALLGYQKVLDLALQTVGEKTSALQGARERIALTEFRLGDMSAFNRLENVLLMRQTFEEPTNVSLVVTRRRIAYCAFTAVGQQESISQLKDLAIKSALDLNPEHLDTLRVRHALGRSYIDAGELAQAFEELSTLVADEERIAGHDHPATLSTQFQLARCVAQLGKTNSDDERIAEGVAALKQVFEDRLRALGPDHPHTLDTRRELALWKAQQGDVPGAVVALEQLEPQESRLLCEGHPKLAATRALLTELRATA